MTGGARVRGRTILPDEHHRSNNPARVQRAINDSVDSLPERR
jgi:hypothetical protein